MPILQMWELRPRLMKPLAQEQEAKAFKALPTFQLPLPALLPPHPIHTQLLWPAPTPCPAPSSLRAFALAAPGLRGLALTLPMAVSSSAQMSPRCPCPALHPIAP